VLLVTPVGRRGDLKDLADRFDPVLTTMLVDERDHHFSWRSNSAAAKYVEALR